MKWSRSKSKKTAAPDDDVNITALVRQDPRTKVKTTSAQSESTNTSTQNSTIFNSNKGTVTFQTTKQTVTSCQTARITEMITRRTPTPQELEEMMRLLHMNKKTETKTFTTTTSSSARSPLRRNRPSNLPALPSSSSPSLLTASSRNSINSISPKSTTKFKSTVSPISRLIFNYESHGSHGAAGAGASSTTGDGSNTPITPTLVKTQTTTVTEKNGRTITQRVEEHRIKFDPKTFKVPTANSPLSRNFTSEDSFMFQAGSDARPTTLKALPPTVITNKPSTTYTSPYSQRELKRAGTGSTTNNFSFNTPLSTTTKPISSLSKTTPKTNTTTTTTSYSAKPSTLFSSWEPKISNTTTTSSYTTTKPSTLFSSWEPTTTKSTPPTTKCLGAIASLSADKKAIPPPTTITTTISPATYSASGKKVTTPLGKPGYAYIINNVVFDNPNNEERIGSAEDVKALVQTFESFKMKTSVLDNGKVDKIKKLVEKIQTKDYSDHACIVIVILSHGTRHEEIAAKDGHYSIDDHVLFPILRNASLNDKPKLFFIQACKGSMESTGYYTDAVPFSPPGSANEILKCYSTFEGFVSYRTEKGSIFIQALCQNLKLFGSTKNIKDIMEIVTQIVKQQSKNKQIPAYTSTLTKPFIFGDYVKFSK